MLRVAHLGDAPEVAAVNVASWQATYRGIVSDDFLDGMSVEAQTDRWQARLASASRVWVALHAGGQVVGYAMGGPRREGPERYTGELYALYLLPVAQRRGLGRRLVAKVAQDLIADGFDSMLVWVLRDNPNRGFYQRLGGKEVAAQTIVIGGRPLPEVALGWPDVQPLVMPGDA